MHNDLISDLDHFHIPEVIFDARAFEFYTNTVASVTFDISSGFYLIHGFVIIPPAQHRFDLEWKGSGMNR